jgi:hypothetical protein
MVMVIAIKMKKKWVRIRILTKEQLKKDLAALGGRKNRWWALLGIGAVGTVAFVVARDKIATGDWWFNRPSDAQLNNANAGMYFLPTRDGNKAKIIKATTNEVFKYQDGVKTHHSIQRTCTQW